MGQFSEETKVWLRSIIKQRKLLIKKNASHISHAVAALAIYRLEQLLNCYPYDNDVYMARFVRQYGKEITDILPGAGSTCHEKKKIEYMAIRNKGLLLENKLQKDLEKVVKLSKLAQYEMAF